MKLFLLLFLGSLVVTFSSCNKNKETTDQKEIIYNLAVESGYTGTYEEWLESIKGDYIELSVTNTHIVWKYSNESAWRDLIELSKLSGEDKTVEFRVNEGYLEWKYTTDTVWTKLYEINTSSSSNKKETITVTFVTDWEMSGYFESEENIVIKESVQRTMNVGNILEPTDILKDGETCNGWYYYDKYNGMTLWLFDAYYASKDITLYGVIDTMYTVSYLDEYNELLYKYSFCENDYAYDLSYDVIQSGYEFIGWTENGVDLFDFYQPINHNVVLKPLLKEYGGNTVNVYLNYNGQSGITYQETDSYYNRIDGKVYTGGDLLPTWKAFSDNLGIKLNL